MICQDFADKLLNGEVSVFKKGEAYAMVRTEIFKTPATGILSENTQEMGFDRAMLSQKKMETLSLLHDIEAIEAECDRLDLEN